MVGSGGITSNQKEEVKALHSQEFWDEVERYNSLLAQNLDRRSDQTKNQSLIARLHILTSF